MTAPPASPRPWHVYHDKPTDAYRYIINNLPLGHRSLVASLLTPADAALVVRAVNVFDGLLTAAQHAAAACPRCGGTNEAWPDGREPLGPCEWCAELRAAIAAAEGA